MSIAIRILEPGDEPAVEAFLAAHPDDSMFLRSNLRKAGLSDRGERWQGSYAAAFEGGRIVSVAAHFWNGNLVLQAPAHLPEVSRAAVAAARRVVKGLIGPVVQVTLAQEALGLGAAPKTTHSADDLFSLDLEQMAVPEALQSGSVQCRLPGAQELDVLTDWRVAYRAEALGDVPSPALAADCRQQIDDLQNRAAHRVLESGGRLVSYTLFNAELPDTVQVGGVFTPANLRGRGYARCAVAGHLRDARSAGVTRAILFTDRRNEPARQAYLSLGFRIVGDYAIVFFTN